MINQPILDKLDQDEESSLFQPGSQTQGRIYYSHDSHEYETDPEKKRLLEQKNELEKKKWTVPKYLQDFDIDVRGDIMYAVHVILENIQVSEQDYNDSHNSFSKMQEIEGYRKYMEDQLHLKTIH